jgi:triphosphoribosyl-dephospho-CoA synthase
MRALRQPIAWTASIDPDNVAALAKGALLAELATWPKPGLVSHVDNGSHGDMDADTFRASATTLEPYFAALVAAGSQGAGLPWLRTLGIDAERAMMASTNGVNTHRGAIFGLGLLCAAAGACHGRVAAIDGPSLCRTVRECWGPAILDAPVPLDSHGAQALRRYGVGGARAQAAAGFPDALIVALPALRRGRAAAPGDEEAARVEAFFAVLVELDDTNILHRGGAAGLAFARCEARRFLADGGVAQTGWRPAAAAIHHEFVARRLSPGGCADILAIAIFLDAMEQDASLAAAVGRRS